MKCTILEVVREGDKRSLIGFAPTLDAAGRIAADAGPGEYGAYERVYEGSTFDCIVEARASVMSPEGATPCRPITVGPDGIARTPVNTTRVLGGAA